MTTNLKWLEGLLLVWRAVGQLNHNQSGSLFQVLSCRQPKNDKQETAYQIKQLKFSSSTSKGQLLHSCFLGQNWIFLCWFVQNPCPKMKLAPCQRDVSTLSTVPSLHYNKLFLKNTVHNTYNNCLKREGFYIFVRIIKTPTPPLINNTGQEMTDRSSVYGNSKSGFQSTLFVYKVSLL